MNCLKRIFSAGALFCSTLCLAQDAAALKAANEIEAVAKDYAVLKAKGADVQPSGDVLARAKAAFKPHAVYPLVLSSKDRMNGKLSDWEDIPFEGEVSLSAKGYPEAPAETKVWFKAALTENALQFLCVAKDPKLNFGCSSQAFYNDCFELFLDPFFKRGLNHDDSTAQIMISARGKDGSEPFANGKLPVTVKAVPVAGGWGVEVSLPLSNEYFKLRPFDGLPLGFNIQYDNNDNGKIRQYKTSWSALDTDDGSWQNPAVFGVLLTCSGNRSAVKAVEAGPALLANKARRLAGETIADPSLLGKDRPSPAIVRGFQVGSLKSFENGEEFKVIRSWGANVIRLQLEKLGPRPTWKPENMPQFLDNLETAVKWADAAGLKVVPIAFEVPNETKGKDIWQDPKVAEGFKEYWKAIATRLKPYKNSIWAYDIFNEPLQREQLPYGPPAWRKMAIDIIKAIREVDPDVWIVYEVGPGGGWRGFEDLQPLPDPHIIYSFHMYHPAAFTHQGIAATQLMDAALTPKAQEAIGVKYPGLIGGIQWNRDVMERELQLVVDFQRKWNVPIFVGEFSVIAWAPVESSAAYLKDTTDLFEKHGWSWAYHAFREYRGWSLEHEEGIFREKGELRKSDVETERAKVIKAALSRNAQDDESLRSQLETLSDLKDFKPEPNEFRIYFIGDSITRHGFNKDTVEKLKWDHCAGMAASSDAKDYVHLVGAGIAKATGKKTRLFVGRGGDAVNALKGLDDAKLYKPDLVVVQLGEHIPAKQSKEGIVADYAALLDALKALPSKPLLIATGVWDPFLWKKEPLKNYPLDSRTALIETAQREVCEGKGVAFVSVEKYALDRACSGSGGSGGVKWHPNDAGQAGYAKEILSAFERQ